MEQNETNSLKHHGILGMKWGVRRYQNKDGSLTPAGKRKAAKMKDEYTKLTGKRLIRKPTPKNTANTDQNGKENVNRKSIKNMSDTEVQKRIDRLQKEKQLMGLQSETASKGEKFVSTVTKQVIVPAAVDAGKRVLTDWFVKGGSELLGLNAKDTKDAFEELQKEAKTSRLKRQMENKLQELKQKETNTDVQLAQIPLKLKDAETRWHQLERKEQEMIGVERKSRTAAYNEACLNLDKENSVRSQMRNKREKDLKTIDSDYRSFYKETDERLELFKQEQAEELDCFKKDLAERKQELELQEHNELAGKGADTKAIDQCRKTIEELHETLGEIEKQKYHVIEYRKDEQELFVHESEYREEKRKLELKDDGIRHIYDDRRRRYESESSEKGAKLNGKKVQLDTMKEGLKQYDQLCRVENVLPESYLQDDVTLKNGNTCTELIGQMRGAINKKRQKQDELKRSINSFNSHFGINNTFHFATPQYDEEYLTFALTLQEFIENDMIEDYRERVSEHYNRILSSVSREVGLLMNHSAQIKSIINEVNQDFQKRNFAGVIRSIELRAEESSDRMMSLLRSIRDFTEENALSIGEINLFSGDDRDQVNAKVVDYLKKFMKQLQKEPSRTELTLSDTFRLQFRIQENDNNTGWVERINNVGSDGTDILVKAMVNIMLINVFKTKASRKNGDFIIHCMMDEIGKLHPSNVNGILQFANVRNIYLINSSPMGYNADIYKYNYLLTKDGKSQTHIKRLMTINVG